MFLSLEKNWGLVGMFLLSPEINFFSEMSNNLMRAMGSKNR